MRNNAQRILNRLYGKLIIPKIEKTATFGDTDIHYLLYKKPSKTLIIGFQALPVLPNDFRYNYVSTLSGTKASKLYIQDDFAPHGNYYLGGNGTFETEKHVLALIRSTIEKCKAEKLIFIGSSKGGYCAVNFGIEFPNSCMVVGAPQYYVGDFMTEVKKFGSTIETVVGSPKTEQKIQKLNTRLRGKIEADEYADTQTVYMHCSVNDKTYEKHVSDMIRDMEHAGIRVVFDKSEYEGHDDLKYHFPTYLKETIKKINEDNSSDNDI